MSIDFDDEILQDFLLEAGELLEDLGEQLVELEQAPEDLELLNAIFRSFHTIKGGAGFLNITPMVSICHQAEDVFNALRQGEQKVQSEMMDTVLQVVDVVNEMFENVREGKVPVEADQSLLDALAYFVEDHDSSNDVAEQPIPPTNADVEAPESSALKTDAPVEKSVGQADVEVGEEFTESEFDDLLEALPGDRIGSTPKNSHQERNQKPIEPGQSHLISDTEFEDLLDEIHGKGKHSPVKASVGSKKADSNTDPGEIAEISSKKTHHPANEINESEFEDLLDQLHGKGQHSGIPKGKEEQPANPVIAETKPEKPAVQPEASKRKVEKKNVKSGVGVNKNPKSTQPPAETTVRVDVQTLDDIMNMVGELVLVRNRFENLRTSFDREQIVKTIGNLDVVTSDLQREVMKTRMQPIKKVFGRFPRVVRDLARSLAKEIRLELRGEDTDLDKNLVEALADPLVHLVRNAVDHGIEMPDQREAAGKSREGRVILTASQEGDHIQLMIEDDGKGMNPDKLRGIVVEKGLMDEESAARLEDRDCFNLIFMPGFSTKSEISDISGRGVGMDVVKTRINQMSGSVEIDSVEGEGSKIIIKVPLTLAIMPTLMVKLNDRPFALPLTSVVEILDLDLNRTNVVEGQLVIVVRDHALPLFYLRDWLVDRQRVETSKTDGHVVVVNVSGRKVGFVVDHLIGQEEVVIKALGAKLQGVDGLSGATITGDGKIALIIDVPSLMNKYAA